VFNQTYTNDKVVGVFVRFRASISPKNSTAPYFLHKKDHWKTGKKINIQKS
jgi:hypothetical protein